MTRKYIKLSLSLFLLLFILVGITCFYVITIHDINEKATVEWKLGNSNEAISLYKQTSRLGSSFATSSIAEIYGSGANIMPNRDEALYYLNKLNKNEKISTIGSIIYSIQHNSDCQATQEELIFWQNEKAKLINQK